MPSTLMFWLSYDTIYVLVEVLEEINLMVGDSKNQIKQFFLSYILF